MTVTNERVRPSGKAETDPNNSGEEVLVNVPRPADSWQRRLLRAWPAVAVYLLAALATVGAAASTMVETGPGPTAVLLSLAAVGNTYCAVVGIRLLVRS